MSEPLLNIPTDGLVLYLDLRKPNGNKLFDYSGKGNHGTIYGATLDRQHPCRGLIFDGVDDYVSVIEELANYLSSTEVTLALWAYCTYSWGQTPVCILGDMDVPPWFHVSIAEGRAFIGHPDGTYSYIYLPSLPLHEWIFISIRYEKDKVFELGINVADFYYSTDYTKEIYVGKHKSNIGRMRPGDPDWWKGLISLVLLHNRLLSIKEIKRIYEETEKRIIRRFYGATDVHRR